MEVRYPKKKLFILGKHQLFSVFSMCFPPCVIKTFSDLGKKKKRRRLTRLTHEQIPFWSTPGWCTLQHPHALNAPDNIWNPGRNFRVLASQQVAGLRSSAFLQAFYKNLKDHFRLSQGTLHHYLTTLWQWVTKVRMMGRGCKRSSHIILAFVIFISLSILSLLERVRKGLGSLRCSTFWVFLYYGHTYLAHYISVMKTLQIVSSFLHKKKSFYDADNVLSTWIFI